MKKSSLYIALSFTISSSAMAIPASIQTLFDKLDAENPEIYAAKLNSEYTYENLRGSKSRLYPSLSLSGVARESSENAFSDPTSTTTGITDSTGGLTNQGTSSLSNLTESAGSGWTGQTSMSYLVFTGFAVTEDIKRSENDYNAAKTTELVTKESKRSQLLQLLLEWQNLKTIEPVVDQAVQLSQSVKRFKSKRSSFLFTTNDNADMNEKLASLEYNRVRVKEGLMLVEAAIQKLIPSITPLELAGVTKVNVGYPLPEAGHILAKYEDQSRTHQNNQLTVDSARGYKRASEWNRPWIPLVSWSASYGYSGDYEGETADNGASTSVLLTFNLFDGFYSQARLQQSRVSLEAAKTKMVIERDKRVLYLMHTRMKANVARAEFAVKRAKAEKAKIKYKDIQRKYKQGIATKLELSAGSMQYSQAELEALDVMKTHQQALLDIAVELNEWEKVEINEKK